MADVGLALEEALPWNVSTVFLLGLGFVQILLSKLSVGPRGRRAQSLDFLHSLRLPRCSSADDSMLPCPGKQMEMETEMEKEDWGFPKGFLHCPCPQVSFC